MRPDDRLPNADQPMDPGIDVPLASDVAALDEELGAAGAQARRALHGRTQPTRLYSNELRARLMSGFAAPAAAGAFASDIMLPRGRERGSRVRPELVAGETWAPTPLAPRIARRTPTVLPRARWSLLAAAALTLVVVAGALGSRFDWLLPTATIDPSAPPASHDLATAQPTPAPTAGPVVVVESAGPTPQATKTPATPKPTRTPRPTPTPKPEPTDPPVKSMDLAAKACPGGVVLDWTKPSPAVGHYHALRNIDGDVPATYPAAGTVEIESATSWSAGVTDGYDASIGGGKTATYRVFAFDAGDHLMAYSPMKTVTTVDRLELGSLGVVENGPGSITVSWAAASVSSACFTYGKLVASEEDPDPSYLKGSPYLAVIGDPAATEVILEGLPSGKTVWMRYEILRSTGTGKFIVASSDVIQVTLP